MQLSGDVARLSKSSLAAPKSSKYMTTRRLATLAIRPPEMSQHVCAAAAFRARIWCQRCIVHMWHWSALENTGLQCAQ